MMFTLVGSDVSKHHHRQSGLLLIGLLSMTVKEWGHFLNGIIALCQSRSGCAFHRFFNIGNGWILGGAQIAGLGVATEGSNYTDCRSAIRTYSIPMIISSLWPHCVMRRN